MESNLNAPVTRAPEVTVPLNSELDTSFDGGMGANKPNGQPKKVEAPVNGNNGWYDLLGASLHLKAQLPFVAPS